MGVTPTEAAKKQDRGQGREMRKGAKREEAAPSDREVVGKALPCGAQHGVCDSRQQLCSPPGPGPFPGQPLPSPPRALRSEEVEPKRREEGPSGLRSPKMGINRDNSGQRAGAEREGGGCKGLQTEKLRRSRGGQSADGETDTGRQRRMPPQEHPTPPECR